MRLEWQTNACIELFSCHERSKSKCKLCEWLITAVYGFPPWFSRRSAFDKCPRYVSQQLRETATDHPSWTFDSQRHTIRDRWVAVHKWLLQVSSWLQFASFFPFHSPHSFVRHACIIALLIFARGSVSIVGAVPPQAFKCGCGTWHSFILFIYSFIYLPVRSLSNIKYGHSNIGPLSVGMDSIIQHAIATRGGSSMLVRELRLPRLLAAGWNLAGISRREQTDCGSAIIPDREGCFNLLHHMPNNCTLTF